MLLDSKLPKFLWVEAVKHAAYLRNRTTTKNTIGSTPHERATGEKPNLAKIPRFGCEVWVHIEAPSKLDAKSKAARWVGFDEQSKAHRVYWPEKRSISVERNLVFVPEVPAEAVVLPEGGNSLDSSQKPPPAIPPTPSTPPTPSQVVPPAPPTTSTPPDTNPTPKAKSEQPSAVAQAPTDQGESLQPAEVLSEPRKRKPSPWIKALQEGKGTTGGRGAQKVPASILAPEKASLAADDLDEDSEPTIFALAAMLGDEPSYREAVKGEEREKWEEAMKEEISRIEAMGTYSLVARSLP